VKTRTELFNKALDDLTNSTSSEDNENRKYSNLSQNLSVKC